MNDKPKLVSYKNMRALVARLRDDLRDTPNGGSDFVLLFAYNGTGKTRLSMAFKEAGKRKKGISRDTLYFNAFTEDLFHWDNDLNNDKERVLQMNSGSKFFQGFKELALEPRIRAYLERYADFNFIIDYDKWTIHFYRGAESHIKVSRGEENMFIWSIFLAICELTLDGAQAYDWVKYLYIDDPISSLDDNNAITVAVDLAQLLKRDPENPRKVKTVLSSHHSLFFNVMCNELKKTRHTTYFLHRSKVDDEPSNKMADSRQPKHTHNYILRTTGDTPFFHHVAMLSELQQAAASGKLYTHHFNMLRSILEKTATFFGYKDFSTCIHGIEDEVLFSRALNLLSHGNYSVYAPKEMNPDNKKLFQNILKGFLDRYTFELPDMIMKKAKRTGQT